MSNIRFTIGKNRLEKTFYYGMKQTSEHVVKCNEDTGMHYMVLPMLDSGIVDCPWGRMFFEAEFPEDVVCYLYVCAMNEPIGEDIMMGTEKTLKEKVQFLVSNKCLRFINKKDVLLYEITGRYLWIAMEIIGEGGAISNIVIDTPGDTFMQVLPEVYREKNSFLHRYLSIFSSMYQDFQYKIEHQDELLDPDKMPLTLVEQYLKWFGMDIGGGNIQEEHMRMLLKEASWLMTHKGTKRCIERICEMFIQEKPTIIERNMMGRYIRQEEKELYNDLYGDSPYDVTLLVKSRVEMMKRRQLLCLLEQFKPVRCRISVVFLENAGILDGYQYMDNNAYVFTSAVADLDDEHLMDGMVVIQ